jgi:hypothetical protein
MSTIGFVVNAWMRQAYARDGVLEAGPPQFMQRLHEYSSHVTSVSKSK